LIVRLVGVCGACGTAPLFLGCSRPGLAVFTGTGFAFCTTGPGAGAVAVEFTVGTVVVGSGFGSAVNLAGGVAIGFCCGATILKCEVACWLCVEFWACCGGLASFGAVARCVDAVCVVNWGAEWDRRMLLGAVFTLTVGPPEGCARSGSWFHSRRNRSRFRPDTFRNRRASGRAMPAAFTGRPIRTGFPHASAPKDLPPAGCCG
jgi:hypothetical protein